jgi:uncharacterized oxidoreductase
MRIRHEALTDVAAAILTSAGAPAEHARLVAEHLVEANLKGHDSHGIGMVASYVHGMLKGLVHAERHASLIRDGGAILAFDGGVGLGRIVGMEAIDAGIERAREHGICCVALGNAAHLGRIGVFGERCAEAGFVSMHYVNVVGHDPGVVPFGGRDSRFVTNPYCCTVPRPDGRHVVLDMATTTIAMGKVRVAMMKGVAVPDDSLVDEEGSPTNDPLALFGPGRKGAMQPFGRHKGYGLMVMCELLGGALGGLYTMQPGQPRKGATINNMLSIIIDPAAVADRAAFDAEVTAMIEYIYASRPAAGFDAVRLPGDPERESRARLLVDGIEIDENSWKVFMEAGERAGFGRDAVDVLLQGR